MKYLLLSMAIVLSLNIGLAQSQIDYSNFQKTIDENFQYRTVAELAQTWQLKPQNQINTVGSAIFTEGQVSLLPEGGVRLTATPLSQSMTAREPQGRNIFYKSAMLSKQLDNPYGIFEIVAKIPNGQKKLNDAWPVFKLVGDNMEVNIFDGSGNINDDLRQNVRNSLDLNTQYQCGNSWDLEDFNAGWENDYHVFQAAWTPDALTFFIHGREVSTIKATQLNAPIESMRLVVALQTDEAGTQPIHFDIKEVTVYKHKAGAPFSYMHEKSWAFHKATSALYDSKVLTQNGAIVPNPNNTNEVFYIGNDHYVHLAKKTGDSWSNRIISDYKTIGDLRYIKNNNSLIFKNVDGSLGGFYRQGDDFKVFRKSNIKLAQNKKALAVTAQGNLVVILANGKIAYLANDGHFTLKAMANVDYNGDLTIAPDETIFFKDSQNQLKAVKQFDLTFQEVALPVHYVSSETGSIIYTTFPKGKGIAFRGLNDQFQVIQDFGGGQYEHTIPAYNYGQQDPKHNDFIASNLAGGQNDVFYVSEDGRLQLFGWDFDQSKRRHYWVDNNFFTQDYLADAQATSLAFGASGQVYYRTKDGSLGYFQWENTNKSCDCETLHANENAQFGLTDAVIVAIFPNPTVGQFKITLKNGCADCRTQFELISANGQRIESGSFEGTEHHLNVETHPAGIYQLNITTDAGHFSKRIIKIK